MPRYRQLPRLDALIVVIALGCSTGGQTSELTAAERQSIADSVRTTLERAYAFDGKNPVPRFLALYPDTGSVVSAASGGFTVGRDSIERALTAFWTNAGQFMQQPAWTWGAMKIDVLSRDAVVVTARYTIPHWTLEGRPHVLGGAWTSIWTHRNGRWAIIQEHLSDLPRSVAERVEATMPAAPPPAPRR